MSRLPEPAAISFQYLAEIAVGATTRIDLCRVVGPHRKGELIAVKRLHPHIAEDPGVSTQFLDEVWMTAALKHPNVVEVAGWGTDAQGSYLAVELVQGVSLARLMKTVFETGEVFPERLVVYVAAQLCRGLAAAHALRSREGELLNLVHRDLTPGNVLIGFKGEVKIADFGMAKAKLRMTQTLTGMLKGEPTYMAPEQARGQDIDRRADLFSLGVVLFELFAGRHPWAASTDYEMVHMAATEPPPDLRELRPKIDKELVSIVTRCLEKTPPARFQSADEILARLDEWLHAHGYMQDSADALGRFVRRNAMRQMRWFERAVAGDLAPSPASMQAGARKAARPPPRVPTYTDTGGNIARAALAARRAKPAADEEVTDITENIATKVAALHGRGPPVIREVADEPSEDLPTGEMAAYEEQPTAVHKGGRLIAAPAGGAPAPYNPVQMGPAIADEDSDLKTTAVKVLRPPARMAAALAPPAANASPKASMALRLPIASEFESEEIPTRPLKGGEPLKPRSARPAPPPGAPAPPRSDVPPVPSRPPPPPPTPSGFRPPPPPQPLPAQPPPPPRTPLPPPFGATMTMEPQEAMNLALRPRAVPASAPPPPPSRGRALTAPMAAVDHGRAPRSVGGSSAPPQSREERLRAEAERLAKEAARLHEEARTAAAQAERKVSMAKVAAHAAAIAAEAVRMAPNAGIAEASRRLEEALALEQSIQRAAATPLSVAPESAAGRIFDPKASFPSTSAERPAPQRSSPMVQAASSPNRMAVQLQRSSPVVSGARIQQSEPVQPTYLRARQDAAVPAPAAPVPQGAYTTGLDALDFRSRLQPMLFGMPRAVALIVAITVFLVVLGALFMFCSAGPT